MALYFYYILLGIYGIVLVVSLFYYFSRHAPSGDASVGWALGILYLAGLAGVVAIAWFLRSSPVFGLVVLSIPLIFIALPWVRQVRTDLYVRFPAFADTPPLVLFIENNTQSALHIKLECWFRITNSQNARLFDAFDFYVAPLEKTSFPLTPFQTRLLAHKSKYVSIVTYERVTEEHDGRTYVRDVQPCMQFYKEETEAFRAGKYTVVIHLNPA